MTATELRQQALEAVRASRDFAPKDARRFNPAEVQELNRLCGIAYRACLAAGVSIAEMRLELYRLEREEHRASLEALCAEFKAAALAQAEEHEHAAAIAALDPAIVKKACRANLYVLLSEDADGERVFTFRHRGRIRFCYGERSLEDEIDDILDGGYMRDREADWAQQHDEAR
jgi:hypothetical protein